MVLSNLQLKIQILGEVSLRSIGQFTLLVRMAYSIGRALISEVLPSKKLILRKT